MNFFQRLSPNYLPPLVNRKGGLQTHREKIIQVLLIIFCVLGLPSTVLAVIGAFVEGKYALTYIYPGVYLLFVGMLFGRNLPYSLRASLIVSVAYLLAVTELFESGQLGEVRMFLICFVALTAVLFNYCFVIGSILLGLFTIITVGMVTSLSLTPIFPSLTRFNEGTNWITSTVVYLMLSTMVAGAISMIIAGLEANLNQQSQLTQKLETERNMLDLRVKERTEAMLQRLIHLHTASDISRAISVLTDQNLLLQQVTETLKDRFLLYYVGVFLVDENRQYAVLRAGTG
ncbi:MAG: hypothetical protein IH586_06785, partial [Anaerolineaceae bacterium]|nr:hypothetical protein [Anaerolineaceae bacterium]